jgi:hypothetical protein
MMITSWKCRPRNSLGRSWLTESPYQNRPPRLQQIQAERQLRNAKPQDKDQARRRFKEALRIFTALVMDGKVPLVKGQ